MTDASTTGADVEALAKRLRLTAAQPREMPNHRIRRYHLERLEASYTLRALVAERDAALQRAESAEQERDAARDESLRELMAMELAALAWEAGRDAAAKAGGIWLGFNSEGEPTGEYCTVESHDPGDMSLWVSQNRIRALTPPADLSAALTARLDAEWNAAIEAAAQTCTTVIKDYDVMTPCGNKYEPIKVQKAAKGMVSLARQDIRALRRAAPTEDR